MQVFEASCEQPLIHLISFAREDCIVPLRLAHERLYRDRRELQNKLNIRAKRDDRRMRALLARSGSLKLFDKWVKLQSTEEHLEKVHDELMAQWKAQTDVSS